MRGGLSLTPSYYEALRRLTLELAGVKVGSDHAFLVETRLASLAREEGFENLQAMVKELFKTGQSRLAVRVVSALVERDTHFFRDPDSMHRLFETALIDIAAKRGGGRIDVLSYGCGSGQEAYSIAIKAAELTTKDGHPLRGADVHVTGVDYPSQALDRARAGRYTHFEVQRGLTAKQIITHFNPDSGEAGEAADWLVKPELAKMTEFREMHLLSGMDGFGPFHAVTFRGVLSLYTPAAQVRILRSLTKLLRPYGYLILGSKDSLKDMNFGLDEVKGAKAVYQKRGIPVEPVLTEGKRPRKPVRFDSDKAAKSA